MYLHFKPNTTRESKGQRNKPRKRDNIREKQNSSNHFSQNYETIITKDYKVKL